VTNLTGEQKIALTVREWRDSGQATVTVEAQAEKSPGLAAGALSRSEERAAQNTKE
jgi:hypothetical protein